MKFTISILIFSFYLASSSAKNSCNFELNEADIIEVKLLGTSVYHYIDMIDQEGKISIVEKNKIDLSGSCVEVGARKVLNEFHKHFRFINAEFEIII